MDCRNFMGFLWYMYCVFARTTICCETIIDCKVGQSKWENKSLLCSCIFVLNVQFLLRWFVFRCFCTFFFFSALYIFLFVGLICWSSIGVQMRILCSGWLKIVNPVDETVWVSASGILLSRAGNFCFTKHLKPFQFVQKIFFSICSVLFFLLNRLNILIVCPFYLLFSRWLSKTI